MSTSSSGKKNRQVVWLMIPLGVGLGIWLGWSIFHVSGPNRQELFGQYYAPHHMPLLFADGGNLRNWTEAAQWYQTGRYEEARLALLRAEKSGEMPLTATRFYIGQCLLATGRTVEALEVYRELMTVREAPHAAIRWYMALAELRLDNVAGAKDLLWEIEDDKGYKAGTAKQLLEEI
jgi:tetratricopeptide (TPR) repeat protein